MVRIGMGEGGLLSRIMYTRFGLPWTYVLGAGGVARAALSILKGKVVVAGRTGKRAEALARSFGAGWVPWEERHTVPFLVLINATPCGADHVSDPLPSSVTLTDRMVLDVIITQERTPLLARADQAGARTITGLDMWFEQGAIQMTRITGHEVTAQELREAYHG